MPNEAVRTRGVAPMPMLSDSTRRKAAGLLAGIASPVRLIVFTQEMECAHCRDNRALAEEVVSLSDRLTLDVHDFVADRARAEELRVDKVPALCICGERDYGIRFYGVPAGFEFTSLLSAIGLVAGRDSGLAAPTRTALADLKNPVDVEVFTTLTCPYCPLAVSLAHRFALESPLISASAVDAGEFVQLAARHEVMAVPKTVVNGKSYVEGVPTEDRLLEEIRRAAG